MVDQIVSVLAQVCFGLCSIALYVFIIAYLLPGRLLKPSYDLSVIGDRGIKKYVFSGGRAIVYETSVLSGRYIKQYILSDNRGEKYIKCKIDEEITSIVYDVIAIDSFDKVIEVVEVSEPISKRGITSGALLPPKTAYVCVVVKGVNGCHVDTDMKMSIRPRAANQYVFWTVLCSALEGAFLNALIIGWYDLALYDFVRAGLIGYLEMLPIYVIAGLIVAALTILCHRSKEVRIRK